MGTTDETWMRHALQLAERGRGYVEPNPLVGAVVVQNGKQAGEGWHQRFGEAHAEVNALRAAGPAAHGATLYVTLEPCCHQGKTPPCTDAIVRSGIRRVVAAMSDPFPQVAGKGLGILRGAGLEVEIGMCESQAKRLNAPYLKLLSRGSPYVHAKWAMTLDGKLATRTGDSRWISNEASRRKVHELRGRMDAIIAGIGTVLADDPLLTVRPPGPRTPVRIVLDSKGRLPSTSRLAPRTARECPVLIVTATGSGAEQAEQWRALGCEVLTLSGEGNRPGIPALLEELGRRRITNVLVEGGSEVLGSFVDAAAIDEAHVFIAPRLVGGITAKTAVGGTGAATLAGALMLEELHSEVVDGDIYLHGWKSR